MKRTWLILPLLALTGCRKAEVPTADAAAPSAVRVPVIEVRAAPFSSSVPVTGTLVSRALVDVKAETTGRVLRFPKQEGDSVQAGESIVWVNQEDHRLAERQAQTAVRVAEAALERARVQLNYATSELERARNLVRSGGITDKDFKAAELAERDGRAQVALAEAQLDQARAALEMASKRVQDTVVKAPVAGEIQKKHVNPGAYVEPPTLVFTLVDNRKLELDSPVPTSEMALLRPGQRVTFSVNAYPGASFEGRLVELNPAVDPETRSARLRIAVSNPGRRLKAGMFATGQILTGVTAQAIIVPTSAVYRDESAGKSSHVFVVENGKAVRRAVRIGRERDGELEILEGLKPGDRLICEQSIELGDGLPVEVRK